MPLDFNKLSDVNNAVQEIANELDALISTDNEDLRNLISAQISTLSDSVNELVADFESGEFDEKDLKTIVTEVD